MKKLIILLLIILPLQVLEAEKNETSSPENLSKNTGLTKSPMGAVYRSLIFPGVGQIYVEKYWKAPIFAAGAGTLYYFIIFNHVNFRDFQDQFESMDVSDPNYFRIKSQRDYYLDNRDQSILFLAGVYLLAAVDAYVGAHLYDFEVNDNISLLVRQSFLNNVEIGFTIRF